MSSLFSLFHCPQELLFFVDGLEFSVSKFGRSIDKLEFDLFESRSAGLWEKGFSDGNDSLFRSSNATFEHEKILRNNTIVRKSSQRSNSFFSEIEIGAGIFFVVSFSDSVDLLVDFGSVEETALTSSWDRVADTGWMPCSNTSNLSETFVGLSWQFSNSPSFCYTFETVTFGCSNDIDIIRFIEYGFNWNLFFRKG